MSSAQSQRIKIPVRSPDRDASVEATVRVVKASSKPAPLALKPQTSGGEFLTVRQVADRLQVSDRQVWRWIETGELLATRFGRSVRIHIDDFRAFWAARREVR